MRNLASVNPRPIIDMLRNCSSEGMDVPWRVHYHIDSPVPYAFDENQLVAPETIETRTLSGHPGHMIELEALAQNGLNWIPTEEFMKPPGEEYTVSTAYLDQVPNMPALHSHLALSLSCGEIQIARKEGENTVLTRVDETQHPVVLISSAESYFIRAARRGPLPIDSGALKRFPQGCALCELLQHGTLIVEKVPGSSWLLKRRSPLAVSDSGSVFVSDYRDPDIDALFSSQEEIDERDRKALINITQSALKISNAFIKVGPDLFEVFRTTPCDDCGAPMLDSTAVCVQASSIRYFTNNGMTEMELIPSEGYEVEERENEDGNYEDAMICGTCHGSDG